MGNQNPNGKDFSFANIADSFTEHITRSIPGYQELQKLICGFAEYLVRPYSDVFDIGASNGSLFDRMIPQLKGIQGVKYHAIEPETAFHDSLSDVEASYPGNFVRWHADIAGCINEYRHTITTGDKPQVSLMTSIFTLQFLPEAEREIILKALFDLLIPGGAFIIAEKNICETGVAQRMMDFLYYDSKIDQDFAFSEIIGKERALRKTMRPMEKDDLVDLLNDVGFSTVEPIWRHLQFGAYLCIK